MVLIKDNHLAALRDAPPNAMAAAVRPRARNFRELESRSGSRHARQVEQAVVAGADLILLDNMNLVKCALAVL